MHTYILSLETSTKACSVALAKNGILLAVKEAVDMDYSHAEKLNLFIEEVMNKSGVKFKQLSAIAVSKGPGSFTGLRIGVSTAKGLAYALEIPLIGVETLTGMASGFLRMSDCDENDLLVPMIDARRKEVYMRIFERGLKPLSEIEAKVIDANFFDQWKTFKNIHLFGDGADKFIEDFQEDNRIIVHKRFFPSGSYFSALSYQKFQLKQFEDLAYFEPFYLKDFIAIKPRKLF